MPEVIFNGPDGRLEGRYHESFLKRENENTDAPVALVLHPHPLHGGTMNNKVVYRIYHAFARNGFSVLRFNFRGVGKSQGQYDEGLGELSDAATALDWLQRNNPSASGCWVAGFSFGSWIAAQLLMRRPEARALVAISPPAARFDFSFLSPCPGHALVVQGTADDICDEKDTEKLVGKMRGQPIETEYRTVEGADHFYKEKMDDLNDHLDAYIKAKLAEDAVDGDDAIPLIGSGEKRRRVSHDNDGY